MTALRASVPFGGLALAIAAGFVAIDGAAAELSSRSFQRDGAQLAQGAQPIQLFQLPEMPRAPARPDEAGRMDGGAGGGAWGAPPEAAGTDGAVLGGEPIAGMDVPEDLGLWTKEDGGLGYDLWRGSRRETIGLLLGGLNGGVDSPTLRTLALRALLSKAEVPGRPIRSVAAGGGSEGNLLVQRGRALLALGEPAYLGALLAQLQGDAAGAPELLKLKTQASLLTGDYGEACDFARDGVAQQPQDNFWTKAQVACQAALGEADRALLGLDLLRESGDGQDAGFSELAGAALGYGKAPEKPAPTPLNLALVLGSDLVPPPSWQDSRDPAVVAMAARDRNLGSERRLALAERAASAGTMQADELIGFYENERFDADQLGRAATLAGELKGPKARALLYGAAAVAPGAARGPLIRQALESARADGVELGAARVFEPMLAQIQPTAASVDLALSAARALFLAGSYELAGGWIDNLSRLAAADPAARQALGEIWPLAKLAGASVPGGPRDLSEWRAARSGSGAAEGALDVVTLRSLLYALGESDSLSFGELLGSEATGALTGTSTLLALEQAAAAGRLGETVLLVVTVVAENGIGGHPYATAKAVEALNRVDRPGEARALAMEAAVMRGL